MELYLRDAAKNAKTPYPKAGSANSIKQQVASHYSIMNKKKNQLGDVPTRVAFEKPPSGVSFEADQELRFWVRKIVKTWLKGDDETQESFQLDAVLVASSLIGADEERIQRVVGCPKHLMSFWAANLRKYGVWKADGAVTDACWFRLTSGYTMFTMDSLVAEGKLVRQDHPNPRQARYFTPEHAPVHLRSKP